MNIEELIDRALAEDIGDGDHTTLACVPKTAKGAAHLLVKDEGILAGVAVARQVFARLDPTLEMEVLMEDGSPMKHGDIAFHLSGSSQSILSGERLALNCMQRMSAIATHTHRLSALIADLPCRLLDTRKTTPGFRPFEKMAVNIGGGMNHRFGLFDMIMIKDNHIDYAGGIQAAIERTHAYLAENNRSLKIEVEARNLAEVEEILAAPKVDRIMLDNFSYADLRIAVERINGRAETEASGGITEASLRDYALCGVDFISVGALTHQVNSLDLSLKASL